MKTCNGCHKEKSETEFGERVVCGKRYLRTQCKDCESTKRQARVYSKGARTRANMKYQMKVAQMRSGNVDTSRWILIDSRRSDKKKGFDNDLDRDFIDNLLLNGCAYCGETSIRMTLDRIDNGKGHTKDNVVAACIRCNYTRSNMPYKAWIEVSEGMRKAREKGLFGHWTGRVK